MLIANRNLLVVDDDPAMRQMLGSLFRERGFAVHEASSADAAIEQARELEIGAVLSAACAPRRRWC
jgi:CheY-like chemotaxis protein